MNVMHKFIGFGLVKLVKALPGHDETVAFSYKVMVHTKLANTVLTEMTTAQVDREFGKMRMGGTRYILLEGSATVPLNRDEYKVKLAEWRALKSA